MIYGVVRGINHDIGCSEFEDKEGRLTEMDILSVLNRLSYQIALIELPWRRDKSTSLQLDSPLIFGWRINGIGVETSIYRV